MNVTLAYHPRPRWPKWLWIQQALERLGHRVRHIRTFGEMVEADRDSDLVLFEHRVPAEIHQNNICEFAPSKRAVWMQWYFDLNLIQEGVPFREQSPMRVCGKLMQCMDLVFVKEFDLLDEYRDMGIKAVYFDQGCPEDYPQCDIPEKPEWDVLVFGARSYQQRKADVRTLVKAGFKAAWAGDAGTGQVPDGVIDIPWCDPWRLPELMSRAAVTLCVDWTHQLTGFHSDRLWLAMGAGACVAKRMSKGETEKPCAGYHSDELVECITKLVGFHEMRRAYGVQARRFVMENHTIRHRCEEIVKHADRIQEQGADDYFHRLCEVPREAVSQGALERADEGVALPEVL